ncbi:MAG: hypothetical protein ACOYO0_12880, partial [Sandarakinorhabdus sp.]
MFTTLPPNFDWELITGRPCLQWALAMAIAGCSAGWPFRCLQQSPALLGYAASGGQGVQWHRTGVGQGASGTQLQRMLRAAALLILLG